MNKNLFLRTVKDNWLRLVIFALVLIFYSWMIVSFFPTIEKSYANLWENIPEGLKSFFMAQNVAPDTLEGFITVEFVGMWIIIMAAFVISFANKIIVKEIEDGTLELLLSHPVSRSQVVVSRALVLVLGLVLLIIVTVGTILLTAQAKDIEAQAKGYLALGLIGFFLFLAVWSYSLIFSAVFSERSRATFLSTGLTIFFYLFDFLAKYSQTIEKVNFLTIFHYYQPSELLSQGTINWSDAGILLLISLICFSVALIIFKKRDIIVS